MKKLSLLVGVVCGVALLASMSQATEVFSRNVVGYHNITIEPGLNLVAFPFQKIPADTGVITVNDENSITVEGAAWDADFGYAEPGESKFYIEIASDPNGLGIEGLHFYIDSVDGDTLILEADGLVANAFNGAHYKIIAANRIRDLFGEPDDTELITGRSPGTADNILLWDYRQQSWRGVIYSTGNAWMEVGVGEVNDSVVDRDEAVFIRKQPGDDVTLTIVGEVSQNDQVIVLGSGLNLAGGLAVIDEQLKDSHLVSALRHGRSPGVADNIMLWGPDQGWEGVVYYTGVAWRQVGESEEVGSLQLSPTRGMFVNVQGEPDNGLWVRESPPMAK